MPITQFPDRQPILGWYDEGTPEVTDWEIKWCLENGISFFMVCWYRAFGDQGTAGVRPALDHWLEEGLFRCRFGDQFQFALMWDNWNDRFLGDTSAEDMLERVLPFWINAYFHKSNYLIVDGRPVVSIYHLPKWVAQMGGEAEASRVVTAMQAACQEAGFAGLYLLGQYCYGPPEELAKQRALMRRVGTAATFSYHIPTFTGVFRRDLAPAGPTVVAAQEEFWGKQPDDHLITVSMGWDSKPWGSYLSRAQWRLTPDEFQDLCMRARIAVGRRDQDSLAGRMLLVDNWNEYGEGHYVFPTREHGFGYLSALRAAFGVHPSSAPNSAPEDFGLGPFDHAFRQLETDKGASP